MACAGTTALVLLVLGISRFAECTRVERSFDADVCAATIANLEARLESLYLNNNCTSCHGDNVTPTPRIDNRLNKASSAVLGAVLALFIIPSIIVCIRRKRQKVLEERPFDFQSFRLQLEQDGIFITTAESTETAGSRSSSDVGSIGSVVSTNGIIRQKSSLDSLLLCPPKASITSHEESFIHPDDPTQMLTANAFIMPRELDAKHLKLMKRLGEGQFGEVWSARYDEGKSGLTPSAVAVKTVKSNAGAEERLALLEEGGLMAQFVHNNVVRLLGVVSRCHDAKLVMENCELGSLSSLLEETRPADSRPIDTGSFIEIASDVAAGMTYLSERNFVHRDLAARNVLVDGAYTYKVADFGMSKHLSNGNGTGNSNGNGDSDVAYYRTIGGMLPIRWCAIEVLTEGRFTTKTDVWAFGVLLYEVLTWGKLPFYELDTAKLLPFLLQGGRLEIPAAVGLPPAMYEELMLAAWHEDPRQRPTFAALSENIDRTFAELLGINVAITNRRSSFKYVDVEGFLRSVSSPTYQHGEDERLIAGSSESGGNDDVVDEEAEYQAFRAAAAAINGELSSGHDQDAAPDDDDEDDAGEAPPPPPPPRPSQAPTTLKATESADVSAYERCRLSEPEPTSLLQSSNTLKTLDGTQMLLKPTVATAQDVATPIMYEQSSQQMFQMQVPDATVDLPFVASPSFPYHSHTNFDTSSESQQNSFGGRNTVAARLSNSMPSISLVVAPRQAEDAGLSSSTASPRSFGTRARQNSVKIGCGRSQSTARTRFKQHRQFSVTTHIQPSTMSPVPPGASGVAGAVGTAGMADMLNTSRSARILDVAMKAKGATTRLARMWRGRSISSTNRAGLEILVIQKRSALVNAGLEFAKTKDAIRNTAQGVVPSWLREIAGMQHATDGVKGCVNVVLQITRDDDDADGFKPSKRMAYKWGDARRAMKKKPPAFIARLADFDPLTSLTPAMLTSLDWYLANPNYLANGPERLTEQCQAIGPLAAWLHAATGCARAQHALDEALATLKTCDSKIKADCSSSSSSSSNTPRSEVADAPSRAFSTPNETSDGLAHSMHAAAAAATQLYYDDALLPPLVLNRSLSEPFSNKQFTRDVNGTPRLELSPIVGPEDDDDDGGSNSGSNGGRNDGGGGGADSYADRNSVGTADGVGNAENNSIVDTNGRTTPNPYEMPVSQQMSSSSSLHTVLAEATATTTRGFRVPVNTPLVRSSGYEVPVQIAPSSSGYEVPVTQVAALNEDAGYRQSIV